MDTPRVAIENELAQRIKRNPSYSMRSFAKTIGISQSLLSLVLSGKRRVSKKTLQKMEDILGLELGSSNDSIGTNFPYPKEGAKDFQQISLDTFALLSEWFHYAILSLLELPDAQLNSIWIAKRLGITPLEARLAISRLKRLNLISNIDGKWRQSSRPLKVENTKSTTATRKYHRQILQKAEESLENDPFETRDFSSMTFAVDPRLIPFARKRIQEFRRQLVKELEQMGTPQEVYQLAVQIYPVTRKPGEKNETKCTQCHCNVFRFSGGLCRK
jgi:transcriptional regulator with XRE-family HTH domain